MARTNPRPSEARDAHPPSWVKPQVARLVDEAPDGKDWLHEVKYDGYRIHARIDSGRVKLLPRTGLPPPTGRSCQLAGGGGSRPVGRRGFHR